MSLFLEGIALRIGLAEHAQGRRLKLDALPGRGRRRELAVHFHAGSGRRVRELIFGDRAGAEHELQIAKAAAVTELQEMDALRVAPRLDPTARGDAPTWFRAQEVGDVVAGLQHKAIPSKTELPRKAGT